MATVRAGEKSTWENWQAKYGEVEQWDEQCWQEQQRQETQWQDTQWQDTQDQATQQWQATMQWADTQHWQATQQQWQEHSSALASDSADGSHIHHQGK
jgi:hypothetical protein